MGAWGWIAVSGAVLVVVALVVTVRGSSAWLLGCAGVLLVAAGGVQVVVHDRLEGRLAAAAADVSGVAGLSVSCPERFFGEFAFTPGEGHVTADDIGAPDGVANLDGWVCDTLADYPGNADSDRAFLAVHILTHEARHVAGEVDEAATDCWAAQRSSQVAQRLGASDAEASAGAARYWAEVAPNLPASYRDPLRCVDGGEWDLDPLSTEFP